MTATPPPAREYPPDFNPAPTPPPEPPLCFDSTIVTVAGVATCQPSDLAGTGPMPVTADVAIGVAILIAGAIAIITAKVQARRAR